MRNCVQAWRIELREIKISKHGIGLHYTNWAKFHGAIGQSKMSLIGTLQFMVVEELHE